MEVLSIRDLKRCSGFALRRLFRHANENNPLTTNEQTGDAALPVFVEYSTAGQKSTVHYFACIGRIRRGVMRLRRGRDLAFSSCYSYRSARE